MPSQTKVVRGMVQSDVRLDGKAVVITGANSGIGYETALDLAGRGAKIIMACRDLTKAESAKSRILEKVENAVLVIKKLDLSSLKSVRRCATEINQSEERIDILINNAGVMMCPQWKTDDGYEMQLGVNHIGHFLFTNLLLDLLKKSAPSRIINISSIGHKWCNGMDWNDVMHTKNYDPMKVYYRSKLANVLHCLELSKRLEGTGVTCNALHPGIINTELKRHLVDGNHLNIVYRVLIPLLNPLARFFLMDEKQGAQTTLYCAIAPELEEVSGKYFSSCAVETLLPHANNMADAEKLWKLSEEWTNKGKQLYSYL